MERLNQITSDILRAAIDVHRQLGPGLLESVYEVCLAKELISRGRKVRRQVHLPVVYKGIELELNFRLDLLVDEEVIVEIKACEGVLPVHEAQVITYLRLADKRVGLLINFNVKLLKDGFKRLVNNF